jgi:citrate lyase subunit beta / citryl-CoA lyase
MTIVARARTALFVPGNRPERIDKAVATASDLVAVDLEDSVPSAEKPQARGWAREKIRQHAGRPMLARVNALDSGLTGLDVAELTGPGLTGIILPKVQRPEDVEHAHALLLAHERAAGLTPGAVGLVLLLESAIAVENAFRIAAAATTPDRPRRLAFGAADFTADMGILLSKTGEELQYPRARIAIASRAAGIAAPLDSPFMTDLKDLNALRTDTFRARQLGFGGRLCVHPNQVPVCNAVFSPSEQDVEFARRVVAAFEASEAEGRGAIQVEGRMVDAPIAAQCRWVLSIAGERTP